ncbi:MAG: response regulator transcription factor [Gracilibacteraceae bacterium]|jgi:DNA-binding response OmpR family regulator|nr:response regulator transcription factor [Gracilibacteraceae bacterium]
MYSILLIEDDKTIRQELRSLLEKYGYEVITTDDFAGAVDFALAQNPHLVLLDINLPFSDGFRLCRELRRQSSIPVVVVTSRESEADELMSLHLGADQFVTKPYNTEILLARIAGLLGRAYGTGAPRLLRFGGLVLDPERGTLAFKGQSAELTRNEMRILRLLLESEGRIVSRDDMMMALWQSDVFVDDNTLTVNIGRLRAKLRSVGAGAALKTRRGQGYSL